MWLLSLLPGIVFDLSVIVGILAIVASFFFSFIPFVSQYKLPIQVVAIALLVFGVFFEGAKINEESWKLKVADAEKKVLELQAQSAEANTKLVEKIAENEKLRKEKKNETTRIITKVVTKYDNKCELSNAFVQLHNSASQDAVPPSAEQIVGGTSDVKASEVLDVVTDNYSICYDIRDRLIGWQEWYKTQREIFDK